MACWSESSAGSVVQRLRSRLTLEQATFTLRMAERGAELEMAIFIQWLSPSRVWIALPVSAPRINPSLGQPEPMTPEPEICVLGWDGVVS